MNRTGIEWCDYTWNPITGCSPVSEGCRNCYARGLHEQRRKALLEGKKLPEYYRKPFEELQFHADRLDHPKGVRKPGRVFVGSVTDLGHKDITPMQLVDVGQAMKRAPWHTYIVLTKRPGPWMRYLPDSCWFGVTVEMKKCLWRVSALNHYAPAGAVRFVSVEPMLEYLTLAGMWPDWVIAGPETGKGARDYRGWWIDHLAIHCRQRGVPFFDKRKGLDGYCRREWPD